LRLVVGRLGLEGGAEDVLGMVEAVLIQRRVFRRGGPEPNRAVGLYQEGSSRVDGDLGLGGNVLNESEQQRAFFFFPLCKGMRRLTRS